MLVFFFKWNKKLLNMAGFFWKLNTSILENQEYCKSIEKLITKYQHKFKEQSNLDILWDNFKLEVRDKTIDHCKKVSIFFFFFKNWKMN